MILLEVVMARPRKYDRHDIAKAFMAVYCDSPKEYSIRIAAGAAGNEFYEDLIAALEKVAADDGDS